VEAIKVGGFTMSFKCPACERPLSNRRRPTCEFCGEPIPPALLMNPAQAGAIDRLKQAEERRRQLKKLSEKKTGGGDVGGWNDPGGGLV